MAYRYLPADNFIGPARFPNRASQVLQLRGNYDDCRVQGTRQLYPLKVGEDYSKSKHKKLRKIPIHQYGQQKVVAGVLRLAESMPFFCKTTKFFGKTRQSDYLEYTPLLQLQPALGLMRYNRFYVLEINLP